MEKTELGPVNGTQTKVEL